MARWIVAFVPTPTIRPPFGPRANSFTASSVLLVTASSMRRYGISLDG